jgi:Fungal protein of unknown function (DUF1752)
MKILVPTFLVKALVMVFDSGEWNSFSEASIRPFDHQPELCDNESSFLDCKSNSDEMAYRPIISLNRSQRTTDLYSLGAAASTSSSPALLSPHLMSSIPFVTEGARPQVEEIEVASSRNNSIISPILVKSSMSELGNSKDDLMLRMPESRNVDYLSHVWREDEIWWSWRHLRSGQGAYHEIVRLENACWRSWAKLKDNLNTTSPESLNW